MLIRNSAEESLQNYVKILFSSLAFADLLSLPIFFRLRKRQTRPLGKVPNQVI